MPVDRRSITDRSADIAREVETFASFDLPTRRFIAHAISLVPELRPLVGRDAGPAGNTPLPFSVSEIERAEREQAYEALPVIRACTAKGKEGQAQRRKEFGALLGPSRVDLKWKRLTTLPAFIFCYERIMGPAWRQLLPLAWKESVLHRRKKSAPAQLPLDPRLRDDAMVPSLLENEPAPWFFPSLADADIAGDAPLFSLL